MNTTRQRHPKLIAVGDLHNQNGALKELLPKLPKGVPLAFVGDLIHKGPSDECAPVVAHIMALCEEGQSIVVRGNHDATPGKGRYVEQEGSLSPEQAEWLKSRPLFVRLGGYLFMHGGIDASVAGQLDGLIEAGHLPLEGDWDEAMVNTAVSTLSSKNRKRLEKCMYVRFLDADSGKMAPFGAEGPYDPFWAATYDGRYGHVVFGHNPWGGGMGFAHASGIDSGAGWSDIPFDSPERVEGDFYPTGGRALMALPLGTSMPLWDRRVWVNTQNES
tara:strand:+ start:526 stop:1347 length:822 start_codon:yes stop_codon:yes gene_type:complete